MVSSRSLLAPRWIVSHVIVLAIVVTFPMLGLWQWDRYGDVRADLARAEERLDAAPVSLDSALSATYVDGDPTFVRVEVTGTWVSAETVAHRGRDFQNHGGFDLLTPLDLGDGRAVLVRRGFVPPIRRGSADPADPGPPPTGEVTVLGYLERPGSQPSFGPQDPDEGVLDTVFHADVDRIDLQTVLPLVQAVIHMQEATPAQASDLLRLQPVPDLRDSSNLSYTIQWFAFTAIAVIGYGVVLRRTGRGQNQATDHVRDLPSG